MFSYEKKLESFLNEFIGIFSCIQFQYLNSDFDSVNILFDRYCVEISMNYKNIYHPFYFKFMQLPLEF